MKERVVFMKLEEILLKNRVIPVVVLNDVSETLPTLSALNEGGIHIAEITFRTPCAADAIALAVKSFPDMVIGAGTVINREQAKQAIGSGARFIVSPGLSTEVAELCRERGIPYLPGCVTPTEIMAALELGLTTLKFFPANIYGGLAAIKALSAPFPQIRFLPTGGVDETNIDEFLSCEKIAAIGGSFMMKGNIVENCRKIERWLR